MTGRRPLSVVVFSGGRGSSVLSQELITHPGIDLTLAINGYDDGMSTGEIRRFLGDALGPSDFRKNASHLARVLRTCAESDIALLDRRLPSPCSREDALAVFHTITGPVRARLDRFEAEIAATGKRFEFSDCAVGNVAFAGAFLLANRSFNAAVDDYCALLNLPRGLIENVTDGTDAYLVALDPGDRLLASEADIVDAKRQNRMKDIFLIDHRPTAAEVEDLGRRAGAEMVDWLRARERTVP